MAVGLIAPCVASCGDDKEETIENERTTATVELSDVARILTAVEIGQEQLREVHDAVSSSSDNGYDEEYTMSDLFAAPGAGVGDDVGTKAGTEYSRPLRSLIEDYLRGQADTKADGGPAVRADGGGRRLWGAEAVSGGVPSGLSADEYIAALSASDVQIYWPYSEQWDGTTAPVITFDPESETDVNTGYAVNADGSLTELVVDEEMALQRPVWVVNRNDDGDFTSLEMLRRQDPSWGQGGEIVVGGTGAGTRVGAVVPKARSGDDGTLRTLVVKTLKAKRNYDSWFAGGSEFFVRCSAVEDFTASTEEEMLQYQPSITDFVVNVKRSEVGKELPFNAILVSNWTGQLESVAFMITEDDGGTKTSWKCSAKVTIKSKSYGFEIELPMNSRDDIVWRGQLASSYIEKYDGETGRFGDLELTFEIDER